MCPKIRCDGYCRNFFGTKQGLISIYVLSLHSKCLIFFLNTNVHSFSVYPREKKGATIPPWQCSANIVGEFFWKTLLMESWCYSPRARRAHSQPTRSTRGASRVPMAHIGVSRDTPKHLLLPFYNIRYSRIFITD